MSRKIGLVFSYGVMITEIVSAMFVTPFIIRSLGQAEYGIYQLTSSITAYLIIFDLGVGNSVIRYMAKFRANNDRESQRKFLGVTTVYYAAVTLVILIVGVLLITVFKGAYFLRDSQGKRAFVHNDCHKCNLNRNIGFFKHSRSI